MRVHLALCLLLALLPSGMAAAAKECPLFTSWDVGLVVEDWRPHLVVPTWNDDPRCWDAP